MDRQPSTDFSPRRNTVLLWTLTGTVAAVTIPLVIYAVSHLISAPTDSSREIGLIALTSLAVGLPLSLACGLLSSKVTALRRQVQKLGQSDNMTDCLNEPTFSALVDTYSNRSPATRDSTLGTILLINLDDLKVVNDRFGYSWGNQALIQIAAAIKRTVRGGDIVGRVSGNQFGVFLPGAAEDDARGVASRIHDNVKQIEFFPSGTQFPLSIRAGAVIVSDRIGFDGLLGKAQSTLATTQGAGSDWIEFTSLANAQAAPGVKPH